MTTALDLSKVLPELRTAVAQMLEKPPMDFSRPMEEIRAEAERAMASLTSMLIPEVRLSSITNHVIKVPGGSIPVRVYRPTDEHGAAVLVYFHGGGWILGSIDSSDTHCRNVSAASGMVVVSVGYRLAPEHPWPTPVEDCYHAVQWVIDHAEELQIDPDALAIGGESAGGNIAAVVAIMCRDRRGPALKAQWLDVPATDLTLPLDASMAEFGAIGPRPDDTELSVGLYAGVADRTHPYLSPLRAENLEGLPPAIVTTAECDPMRDQGEAYADRLRQAGVPVRHTRWDGHLHATMVLTSLHESAERYLAEVVQGLTALTRGDAVSGVS